MKKIEQIDVTFAFTDGGLGDNIARLSAVKYCLDNYKHVRLRLAVPAYFKELTKLILPDCNVYTVDEYNSFMKIRKTPIHVVATSAQNKHTNIRAGLLEHAYNVLLDYQPDGIAYKNYVKYPLGSVDISKYNLPENYIVIPMMFTAGVREFPPHVIYQIMMEAKNYGLDTVFLGKSEAKCSIISDAHIIKGNTNVDLSTGINLLDQTTLPEAVEIMGRAKAVITLDSGLGHLAATTDVPLIIGYTTVEPHQRNPQRNDIPNFKLKTVIPPEKLKCRFCQSKMNFVFKHDFRECFYEHKNCITRMKSEPWIEALNDLIRDDFRKVVYE